MSEERRKVRFNEIALEYDGYKYVSIKPVPLLPGDNDDEDITYDNDHMMNYHFSPHDLQIIEQHLRKVSDPSKYTINFG